MLGYPAHVGSRSDWPGELAPAFACLAASAAARACGDHMVAYRKLVLPYGANVPGPPGMSLVRIGTWLMVIAHCSMASLSVLSTTRGMGCKALRGTVCHDMLAISASFALQHFWRHLARASGEACSESTKRE